MSTQEPREIAFEDIRAGDRIRTEHPEGGVKFMCEGVAHKTTHDGWFTSEGGLIVSANSEATITLLHRPVPAEPEGLGAVVRTAKDIEYVSVNRTPGTPRWVYAGLHELSGRRAFKWDDFDLESGSTSIEVLSEGNRGES